jgi:hypothetical protein
MGEFAKRISDGVEIKIGTCEDMFGLRYEDRMKVLKVPNSLNPVTCKDLFWRLPFPDEDNVPIGEYKDLDRGLRLFKMVPSRVHSGMECAEDFRDESTLQDPGGFQLRHEGSGLTLWVPCYHGMKLPDTEHPMKAGWNGKGHSFELVHNNNTRDQGIRPIVGCRHCGKMWRYTWEDVLPYVYDQEMRRRLEAYAAENVT